MTKKRNASPAGDPTTIARAQAQLLNQKNHELLRDLVAYSEAVGSLMSSARAALDLIHEQFPTLGQPRRGWRPWRRERRLDPALEQAIVAFRRVVYGLVPSEQKKEHERDRHQTGPEGIPEAGGDQGGPDAGAGREAPAGDGAAGGEAQPRQAAEGETSEAQAGGQAPVAVPREAVPARVVSVLDGETLELSYEDSGNVHVFLRGYRAPGRCEGEAHLAHAARLRLHNALAGTRVLVASGANPHQVDVYYQTGDVHDPSPGGRWYDLVESLVLEGWGVRLEVDGEVPDDFVRWNPARYPGPPVGGEPSA